MNFIKNGKKFSRKGAKLAKKSIRVKSLDFKFFFASFAALREMLLGLACSG
jgi:hypothetical protein